MRRSRFSFMGLVWLPALILALGTTPRAEAQDAPAEKKPAEAAPAAKQEPPPPPPPPDRVTTKDGSIILGEVKELSGGSLKIATKFDGDVDVKWDEVKRLDVNRTLPFHLKDGTVLNGKATSTVDNELKVKGDTLPEAVTVKVGMIHAINPTPKPTITYKGGIGAGGSFSDGNTKTRTASGTMFFEAKSERQRLGLNGYWNYADSETSTGEREIITRNARGSIKYDFFMTKRLYTWAATSFEGDSFQDITLRWIGSAGLGWQLIRDDDIQSAPFKGLEWNFEAGVGYIVEDRRRGEDDSYTTGRWAMALNWPILPNRLTFFHVHEGYPSLEDKDDLYVISQTGLRMTFVKNFFGSVQVNHRWDNTPAPGFKRLDTLYIWTLGYNFEF